MASGMMICGGFARCRVKGKSVQVFARKTDQGDSRIAVTAYQNDVDNAAGKATKRLLQRLYERISGVTLSDVDTPVPAEPAKIETDTVSEPEPARVMTAADWVDEIHRHGGKGSWTSGCANRMYVAADSVEPMAGIAAELQEAAEAMAAKTIDQRAYATLERYGAWLLGQKEYSQSPERESV